MTTEELAIIMQKQFDLMNQKMLTKMDVEAIVKREVRKEVEPLKNAIDGFTKNFVDNEDEKVAHTAAHDRFNENFYKIKNHLDLKSIKAVEPM